MTRPTADCVQLLHPLLRRWVKIDARTARYGELKELARTFGRSADSLSVQICRLRRGGYVPKSWGEVE